MSTYGRTIPLSETTKFIVDNRGKTAPTAESGIALIATNCISNDHLYPQYINVRRVSQETYDSWFRAHPEPGDIIITNKGSQNGAICLIPDPVDFVIAQDMVALRANEKVIAPLFLFAVLRSPMVQLQIKNLDVSGIIPHFKKTDFDKLHLPYPDMKTQEAIGRIYFDFCAKIELNRRMNETLECLARAIFQSWFVDFDPVRAQRDGLPPPALDQIPTVQQLFDRRVLLIGDGYRAKRTELGEPGLPFVRAGNLQDHGFTFDNAEILSEASVAAAGDKISQPYDVAFTSKGTVGRITLVTPKTRRFVYSPQVCFWRVLDRDTIDPHVLYRWMESAEFMDQVARVKGQTDMAEYVSLRDQRQMRVALPKIEEQRRIAGSLKLIDDSIAGNAAQSMQLAAIRDALLPKLLSGEIRVAEAERLVEDAG